MSFRYLMADMLILGWRRRFAKYVIQLGYRVFSLRRAARIGSPHYKIHCQFLRFFVNSSSPRLTQHASMVSYLRSFFGGYASGLQSDSKNHKRSASMPSAAAANPNLSYIYAAPGTTPPVALRANRERSNSYVLGRANYSGPSPLRYPTYNSGSASQSTSHLVSSEPPPKLTRTHIYRTTSDKPGDRRASFIRLSRYKFLNKP